MTEQSGHAEHAEVVIIGGGIMGTSLAFALTELGIRDVVVVERSSVAAGASGRTGALLRQHYTNLPEATLAQRSLEIFAHWSEIVGGDCGFEPTGSIITVATRGADAANIERMRRNVAMQQQLGIKAELINGAQLRALQPFTVADDLDVAAYESESGYVDAVAATQGMAAAAARGGARIAEGRLVTDILVSGDRVAGVATDDGPIHAGSVVCAAGAWSVPLLEAVGVRVPITAQRVQVAILGRPLELPSAGTMCYVDTAAGFFCRNAGPGRTLVGVGGGEFHDIVDPFSFEQRMSPGYGEIARSYMARRMPAMARATVLYGYACLYDLTPDAHPILGPSGEGGPDGLYLMLGFSGAGFKKGPAVGRCMAELVAHGASASLDLSPFRLSRFDDEGWRQPWSPDEYSFSTDFGHKF